MKVVASDLSTGKMRLFSTESEDCRNVSVADAVAASCAIPFVFKPVEIDGNFYCDGGMVSNLPAWTLDEHLILDDESWVITSELLPPRIVGYSVGYGPVRPKGGSIFSKVATTALFGAADLNTRGVAHHVRIPLPTDVGVLDFDLPAKKAITDVLGSRLFATEIISTRFRELQFLKLVHLEAEKEIQKMVDQDNFRLRSALVRTINLSESDVAGYHLWACEGFENDADNFLKLSRKGTLIGSCLNGEPEGAYADLTKPEGKHRFYSVDKGPRLRLITPECRKWAMAFPLLGPKLVRISVAITFDCDVALGDNFNEVRLMLKKLSTRWLSN